MSQKENDLDEMDTLLAKLYDAQRRILFQEMMMQIFMEQTKLSEQQAIGVLKEMIKRGWLVCDAVKEKFFLRPKYVYSFPVVISRKGIKHLKEKGLIKE